MLRTSNSTTGACKLIVLKDNTVGWHSWYEMCSPKTIVVSLSQQAHTSILGPCIGFSCSQVALWEPRQKSGTLMSYVVIHQPHKSYACGLSCLFSVSVTVGIVQARVIKKFKAVKRFHLLEQGTYQVICRCMNSVRKKKNQ